MGQEETLVQGFLPLVRYLLEGFCIVIIMRVDPPQFIARPFDTIGKQGGQAVFESKATKPAIHWRKQHGVIPSRALLLI